MLYLSNVPLMKTNENLKSQRCAEELVLWTHTAKVMPCLLTDKHIQSTSHP